MVKLSELRNRSLSDGAPPKSFAIGAGTPRSSLLSPTDSVNSTTSTWTAGSPISISSPAPPLGSPNKQKSFTERHGGPGKLTRKFSKKISFVESSPSMGATPLETQLEEPSSPNGSMDTPLSVPIALKGVFTDTQIRTFKQLFEYYDKDNSGAIDKEELTLVLSEMGEKPSEDRVNNLMNEVDFDGNGVIDFEEFLHVMNEKRGGDSSFSAIVHRVEKKLNPLLVGHQVTFMHKGSKVTGILVKKHGPFWTVDLGEGVLANSIPTSSLTRPATAANLQLVSSASAASPPPPPASSPPASSPPPAAPAYTPSPKPTSPWTKGSKTGLKLNTPSLTSSMFQQVGVPDSPSMSSVSSLKSLPGFSRAESKNTPVTKSETKASSKKVPAAENKASSGQKAEAKGVGARVATAESKGTVKSFSKPSLGKMNSTEEKKMFGEMKTTESVKPMIRQSLALGSPTNRDSVSSAISSVDSPPVTSPALSEKKKPMGSFETLERPKGAFESMENPVPKSAARKKVVENKTAVEFAKTETPEKLPGDGTFDASQVATFRELFKFYDKGGSIHKSELLTILSQMYPGETLPPNILNTIIDKVDRGDGRIGFEAFLKGLARAKATKEYYTDEKDLDDDSPIRSPKSPLSPGLRGDLFGEMSEVKGGSSDEEEEEKWQDHRRNWFKKSNMTPQFQKWQGSSPSSPDNIASTPMNTIARTSGLVTGSSPNLGIANIDTVLASLFPKAKIQHSSNGTVLITPNPVSVIESPPTRLEEMEGRFGINSRGKAEQLPRKQFDESADSIYESSEDERRAKALRGRNLIGGILTNQQSEKKAQARAKYMGSNPSNPSTARPPSVASSRDTPLTDSSSPPRPPSGEMVISSAALRLEWAKQQQQAKRDETPLSTKDLAKMFAEEATPRPKVAKAPRRPPVVMKSDELKIKKPSEPLKMSPSKLMSSGGSLSSFSMCIYDAMGCVISGVGRVVHVLEGGQAHRAGVAPGDFVTGIGKYKVSSIETIQAALEAVRRDVEFKNINREMDRRKDKNSPDKSPNKRIGNGDSSSPPHITPNSLATLSPTSPVTECIDIDDQVLVIVMTPGATKLQGVPVSDTKKAPSSYYAVL